MRRLITGLALLLTLSVLTAGQTTVGRLGANLPKPAPAGGGGGGGGGLLQSSNFVYVGSLLLPTGAGGTVAGLQYWGYNGDGAITFNPSGNGGLGSLLMSVGDAGGEVVNIGKIAEVSIPTLVQGDHVNGGSTNILALNRATFLQDGNFHDITGGALFADPSYGNGAAKLYGLLVYGGKIYGTVLTYYDASSQARVSHFSYSSLTLGSGTFFGWETVRDPNVESTYGAATGVGMSGGYLGDIPSALQASLGGPAFTGQWGTIAIVGRTSAGPALFSFNPSQIGSDTPSTNGYVPSSSPVAAHPLLYYPTGHRTLGEWNNAGSGDQYSGPIGTYYSWADFPAGGILEDQTFVMPEVAGVGQTTNACGTQQTSFYGPGVTDCTLNGTLNNGGAGPEKYAYDLAGNGEGQHAWPYIIRVLLYSVADLQTVSAGGSPWVPVPYAKFNLPIPFDYYNVGVQTGQNARGIRVAYDRANRLMYVVQLNSQDFPSGYFPMVHVFHLTAS